METGQFKAMTNYLAIGIIENFKQGWAIIPFKQKPHYWQDVTAEYEATIYKGKRVRFYKSLCGVEATTHAGKGAIVTGNFPKCKRCLKINNRASHTVQL